MLKNSYNEVMNYTPLDLNKIRGSSGRFLSPFKMIFFSALFLFLLFVGSLTAMAYTNFKPPFVSSEVVKRVKVYFASLPFLPKTKEQVVLATVYKASKVKSFNVETSGALSFSASGGSLNLDFNSKGFFDFSEKGNLKSSSELDFSLGYLGVRYDLGLKTITTGGNTYVKIVKFPDKLVSYLKENAQNYGLELDEKAINSLVYTLTSSWIKFEGKKNTAARQELNKDESHNSYKQMALGLLDDRFLKRINFSKREGVYTFYKSYTGPEFVRQMKRELLKEGKVLTSSEKEIVEILEQGIKEFKITAEVGKDYYIRKIASVLKGNFDLEKISGQKTDVVRSLFGGGLGVEGALTFQFSGINEVREVSAPENYKDAQQFYLELQKQLMSLVPSEKPQSSSYASISLMKQLVLKLEEYKALNGRYPENLTEYFLTSPNPSLERKVKEGKIFYLASSDKKSYLIYTPYGEKKGKIVYFVYSSSKSEPELLGQKELTERVSSLRKDVLGVFMERIIE